MYRFAPLGSHGEETIKSRASRKRFYDGLGRGDGLGDFVDRMEPISDDLPDSRGAGVAKSGGLAFLARCEQCRYVAVTAFGGQCDREIIRSRLDITAFA